MEERKTKELTTEEVNVYIKDCGDIKAVSYTHLTLPTIA